jgi:hypothetical protein
MPDQENIMQAEQIDVEKEKAGDNSQGYLPLQYYIDFLKMLAENTDRIKVITYRDFCWGDDYDYQNNYPAEHAAWTKKLRKGEIDPGKIYVLLQHDVDSNPGRTIDVAREEERLGVPSNIMIFNKRISRRYLKATGKLLYTGYPLDYDYLHRLQEQNGFVIGYHCNAFEQGLFDMQAAKNVFESDVRELREHFAIDFFSPHGGTPSPNGLNNHDLEIPASLSNSIRWVHNRHTPWFTSAYSDGGINSPKRDPEGRDLRDFVRTWQPGGRYRVLTHPQYYMHNSGRSPRLTGAGWYEEVLNTYSQAGKLSAWNSVAEDIRSGKVTRKTPFIERVKRALIHRASKLEWAWKIFSSR